MYLKAYKSTQTPSLMMMKIKTASSKHIGTKKAGITSKFAKERSITEHSKISMAKQ